jgi:hypothetical protein
MRDRHELDALLNRALETYGEPRGGIEQRVLAGVAAEQTERAALWRRSFAWGLAVTLVASAALYVATPGARQPGGSAAPRPPAQATVAAPQLKRPGVKTPDAGTKPRMNVASGHTPSRTAIVTEPTLDVFPSPRPLGPQEHALLALAQQSTEVRRGAFETPRHDDGPLQISAIQIQPISQPDEGKN